MAKQKQAARPDGLLRRIWTSLFRGPFRPGSDSDRARIVLGNIVLHSRPVRVPRKTIRYTHTWGLGGMSATLFLLLVLTGLPLLFVYEPFPGYAYESIRVIRDNVFFGSLVRAIHYWSANFLAALALLHMARVYLTGAYHHPRQFNWVVGLTLLSFVLISNFTGYLLPWDQLSYWAVTIVTGMLAYIPFVGGWLQTVVRGGNEIGSGTLVTFYAVHTTVMPVLFMALMAFHFWRVRKARGVVIPRRPGEDPDTNPEMIYALPHLFTRELAAGLALVAFVMIVAVLAHAPLGEASNPGMSPDPAKAPWYFMGFQELLVHFDPVLAIFVIPLAAICGLVLIPYIKYDSDTSGVFLMSRNGRRIGFVAATMALILTPLLVIVDEFWLDVASWAPRLPNMVANGLLPLTLIAGVLVGFYTLMRWRLGANRDEAIQGLAVFLTVSFVVLTIVGVWFRGAGMTLVWPG